MNDNAFGISEESNNIINEHRNLLILLDSNKITHEEFQDKISKLNTRYGKDALNVAYKELKDTLDKRHKESLKHVTEDCKRFIKQCSLTPELKERARQLSIDYITEFARILNITDYEINL